MDTATAAADEQVRAALARNLRAARKEPKGSSAASGVGRGTIRRLEAGTQERVDLSTVYLLAQHYGCSLASLLDIRGGVQEAPALKSWPAGTPSLPVLDERVRQRLRELRTSLGYGTPRMAALAGVTQSVLYLLEEGRHGANIILIERIARVAGTSAREIVADVSRQGVVHVQRTRNAPAE